MITALFVGAKINRIMAIPRCELFWEFREMAPLWPPPSLDAPLAKGIVFKLCNAPGPDGFVIYEQL